MAQLLHLCNHFLDVNDAIYVTEILLAKSCCLLQGCISSLGTELIR